MGGDSNMSALKASLPKLSAGPVGKQIHSIYKGRLAQFTDSGQYYQQGLLA